MIPARRPPLAIVQSIADKTDPAFRFVTVASVIAPSVKDNLNPLLRPKKIE